MSWNIKQENNIKWIMTIPKNFDIVFKYCIMIVYRREIQNESCSYCNEKLRSETKKNGLPWIITASMSSSTNTSAFTKFAITNSNKPLRARLWNII